MAVSPRFAGQLANLTGAEAMHTIELYLDYVCPYSAKMFKTIQTSVRPIIEKKYSKPGVRLIFRQQIQPWHPSSTLVHEAGVAVLRIAPSQFWQFSELLFERQKEFFDVNVVNESRNKSKDL
jgi:protein-disulfide isomerase